jgi:hypothetical protein
MPLQVGNDATLSTLSGYPLTAAVTGTAVTDATVSAQPYKLTSGAWATAGDPVTLSHVSAGTYRGTLQSSQIDAHFSANDRYRIVYTAVSGASDGRWVEEDTVLDRMV